MKVFTIKLRQLNLYVTAPSYSFLGHRGLTGSFGVGIVHLPNHLSTMLIRRASILILLFVEGVTGSLANNPLASFSSKDLQIREIESETMPSLFGPEEAQFDRYAACLAATEGLRRIRDKKLGGRRFLRGADELTDAQKRITSEYVVNSSKVLEAMGMSVGQFNQLGRQVGSNGDLKEKVCPTRLS